MVYSYYDYLENYWEDYYDEYYQYIYWPRHFNDSYTGTYPPSAYEYSAPYNISLLGSITVPLNIVMTLLCLIVAITLSIKTFRNVRTETKRITVVLPLLCVWMYVCQNICDVGLNWTWYLNFKRELANAFSVAWYMFFTLAKFFMFATFIHRYYLIFQSIPGTSHRQTVVVFGCFGIVLALQGLAGVAFVSWGWLPANWAFAVMDCVLLTTITFLMCKSVVKVVIVIQSLERGIENERTHVIDAKSHHKPVSPERLDGSNPNSELTTLNVQVEKQIPVNTEHLEQERRLNRLLKTATKILTTGIVSMLSTSAYQIMWNVAQQIHNDSLIWIIESTWAVDAFVSALCIYLSLSLAKKHYNIVCVRCCGIHRCVESGIRRCVKSQVNT